MDIVVDELTAAVGMAEEVCDDGNDGAEDLCRDMPAVVGDLGEEAMTLASLSRELRIGREREMERWKARTPRTMPTGKMTPKANIMRKMCIHSVVSYSALLEKAPQTRPIPPLCSE